MKKSSQKKKITSHKTLFSKTPVLTPLFSDAQFWQNYFEIESMIARHESEEPFCSITILNHATGKRKTIDPIRLKPSKGLLSC